MISLKEKKEKEKVREDKSKGYIYIGKAMDLLNKEVGKLYWERPQRQMIVFGASGSGKSEFLTRLMYEDIVNGFQSFNIDPKGSKSWLEAFFKACDKIGVLYDKEGGPIVFALNYPEVSFRFNPLYGMDPHQIASVIASGLPDSKEPFWWNISYEITLAIALGLHARGMRQICFGDIYEFLNVQKIEELRRKILDVYTVSQSSEIEQALTILDKIASYDPQYFPRVNSTLRTYLTRLITGKTGYLLNVKTDRDILRERIRAGKLRFFAFLNAEKEGQTAYDVARLLFAWLLAVVGEYSKEFEVIEPQLRVNVDEATEVGFWEINKAIRLVRERNVAIKLFTQSPSGFKSAFKQNGDNIVQDIINNCDCRIAFSINEPEDQEYFARMSGELLKPKPIIHKSSIALTYQQLPLVEPRKFGGLPAGWGYAFLDSRVYLFYSPLVPDRRRVKVVWKEEEKENKGSEELVIDLHKFIELLVMMMRIKQNAMSFILEGLKDPQLEEFRAEFEKYFIHHFEDFEKILRWMDGVKSVASVVKGKNPLKNISLIDHSLRVARNAIEELKAKEDIPQDEKERIVLASLAHDLGKATAQVGDYTMSDHVEKTVEVLSKLEVDERIIKLASQHHEKKKDPSLEVVKTADHKAREEETYLVEDQIISLLYEKLDTSVLWDMLSSRANEDEEYKVWTYKTFLCVKKEYLENWIANKLSLRPTEGALKEVLSCELKTFTLIKGREPVLTGRFYVFSHIPDLQELERRKVGHKLWAGVKIEEIPQI